MAIPSFSAAYTAPRYATPTNTTAAQLRKPAGAGKPQSSTNAGPKFGNSEEDNAFAITIGGIAALALVSGLVYIAASEIKKAGGIRRARTRNHDIEHAQPRDHARTESSRNYRSAGGDTIALTTLSPVYVPDSRPGHGGHGGHGDSGGHSGFDGGDGGGFSGGF